MTDAGRNTPAALLLLFALIFAMLVAVLVPAFLSWTENGRIIRENREKMAAIRTSQRSFVRVKIANDRWSLFATSPDAGFLDAATMEGALEAARGHLVTLAERHGGVLDAVELSPGETKRTQVETILMQVTAIIPKAALARFLADLEDVPPYTFISAFRATQKSDTQVELVVTGQMQRLVEAPL